MATKPYSLTCPDPECAATFTVNLNPETDLIDDGECITCPRCGEEWDWEHEPEADTLELVASERDDDDEDEFLDDDDEDPDNESDDGDED